MSYNKQKKPQNLLKAAFSGWEITWEGIFDNRKGEWWLIGQLFLIGAHLIPPWPLLIPLSSQLQTLTVVVGAIILSLGFLLSVQALIFLGPNLSPLPDPKSSAILVREGPYKRCRHPLYQGLLISSLGFAIILASPFHFSLLIALSILLRGKAKREERQLLKRYKDYINYIRNTSAILPNIPGLDWHE